MKVLRNIIRILMLNGILPMMLFFLSCQDGSVIYFHFADLPVGTQAIRLNRRINGKPELEPRYYSENLGLGRIGLRLPPGVSGILEADLDAINGKMCKLGTATGSLPLGTGRDTIDIQFTPSAVGVCNSDDLGTVEDMSAPQHEIDMSTPQPEVDMSVPYRPCVPACSAQQFCINSTCNDCDWRITNPRTCAICTSGNSFDAQNNNGTQTCPSGTWSACSVTNFTRLVIKSTDPRWTKDCSILLHPSECYILRGPNQNLPAGTYMFQVNGSVKHAAPAIPNSAAVDVVFDLYDATNARTISSLSSHYSISGSINAFTLFRGVLNASLNNDCHALEIRVYAKTTSGWSAVIVEDVTIERM